MQIDARGFHNTLPGTAGVISVAATSSFRLGSRKEAHSKGKTNPSRKKYI